jgi:type I restriction enzyme M protein
MERGKKAQNEGTFANLGFEATLSAAAEKLHANLDTAAYKHAVLGLIFLKSTSGSFEEDRRKLIAAKSRGADPEDLDECRPDNMFWGAKEALWSSLQTNAKHPAIGAIERKNKSCKGVLPKDYAPPATREVRPGELIDLVGTTGLGDKIEAGLAFPLLPGRGP